MCKKDSEVILKPKFNINVGFAIIVLGAFLIIFGSYSKNTTMVELGKFAVTAGMAVFAIGIALDSTEKMKSIANVQFLQVVNMLEDARVYFIAKIYNAETYTWKTKSSVEMAVELLKRDEKKKYIEPNYQDKLFHYFNMSSNHFFRLSNWRKQKKLINHLITSYAMLEDYYNALRKKEFNEALEEYLGEDKKDFLERVKETKKTLD